jgi:Domain of unknown function (DUF2017)
MHGIRRTGEGFRVGLLRHERSLLRQLCERLTGELAGAGEDEGLARLFPSAYDDEEAAAEYERLVRPGLADGKLAALRRTAETATEARLDVETAETWLRALNDLRLVLGTRLGVTEDTFGASRVRMRPEVAIYGWLTWLEGELIEALAAA